MHHPFILRYLRRPSRHDHHHLHRHHPFTTTTATTSVVSSINWVRDRALDHAVEKERDLKPMINLKNLIISQPSKSLPLNIISDNRSSLHIPTRPIDFIRKYPSVFQEFLPGGVGIHPHVKLTPETLTLDAEEHILFESEIHKKDVANRLLKLLMIGRMNKIPLSVIDKLKWDLGLPNDYAQSVVPLFPDYFQVAGDELELVCWSDELAVSVMEMNSMSAFPVRYSRGFEVDKKFKRWVDDWQKLPYVSPYGNESNLQAKSEESEKWIVGLMHEVLHLLVPKKTEKDNLLFLGEYLGVRSRFKRALLQHPGIFYVSSKLNTHTVVLREAYKRDLLVSKPRHPLMNLRSSYIHLMNIVKENSKAKNTDDAGVKKQKDTDTEDVDEEDDELSENEEDDSETEGVTDVDSNNGDTERDNLVVKAKTPTKRAPYEAQNGTVQKGRRRRSSDNGESEDFESGNRKIRGRASRTVKFDDSRRRNARDSRGDRKYTSDDRSDSRTNRVSARRVAKETNPLRSLRTEAPGARVLRGRLSERSGASSRSDSRTNRGSDRRVAKETNPSRSLRTEASGGRVSRGRSSERSGASRTREGRF